ncbi:MAG TPA: LytR C-terminal domain-containing protein [Patescibacteria group bacterium]|nr:LytR C-terminal domain-containing protein [Patescibacteria group bacterium]
MENRFRSNLTGDLPSQGGSRFSPKIIIAIIIVLVLAGAGYWVYTGQAGSADGAEETSDSTPASTNEEVLAKLSKIYVVPEGEVAQVRNAGEVMQSLADKSILGNAQESDKLIIYNSAGKVIVYRPSTNQVVNILPLNPQQSQPADTGVATGSSTAQAPNVAGDSTSTAPSEDSSNDPAPAANLTGEVRNGTTTSGAAGTLAKKLQTDLGLKTVKTANAANTAYTKTILVNLTHKNVSAVEKQLGVTAVNELPAGEKPSTADFLVIIGK